MASTIRMGSIKNKVVASDLEDERKQCNFDLQELTHFVWGGADEFQRVKGIFEDMERVPELRGSEKWYDMSREEQQENALKRVKVYLDNYKEKYFTNFKQHFVPWWTLGFQGLVSNIHTTTTHHIATYSRLITRQLLLNHV